MGDQRGEGGDVSQCHEHTEYGERHKSRLRIKPDRIVRCDDSKGRIGVVSRSAKPHPAARVLCEWHSSADDPERSALLAWNNGLLMSLATQNNAIIVKDGKLAENCVCCGGWYCCADAQCILDDFTDSIAVTVTTGDDQSIVGDRVASNFSCGTGGNLFTLYSKIVAIIEASHYAGTFSLTRKSPGVWEYSYTPDTPGNVATLQAILIDKVWIISLNFHSYAWRKTGRDQISNTKTISDMKKFQQGDSTSIVECYSPPEEFFFVRTQGFSLQLGFQCGNKDLSSSRSASLRSVFYEQEWSGYTTGGVSGASNISMDVLILATK